MSETEARAAAGLAVSEAEARVEALKRAEAELRERLRREREEGAPSAEEAAAAVAKAEAEVAAVQARIDAAKREAAGLKAEAEELERKYEETPEAERAGEWPRLVGEKMRRLIEVRVRESSIAALEGQKWAATGALEAAKQRVAALEAGAHELPLKEDPRLLSLQEEQAAAVAALKALKPSGRGRKKS
jgi:colicin import membrane protein